MSWRETAIKNLLIWLAVYPSVCLLTYAFGWLGWSAPIWLETLVSTALVVPLISYVAQPAIQRRMAHAGGESVADLKRREAQAAEDE
jgi:antibiotic biosynthesis monooxygenase (ABM) superfamily enzyme